MTEEVDRDAAALAQVEPELGSERRGLLVAGWANRPSTTTVLAPDDTCSPSDVISTPVTGATTSIEPATGASIATT